jgi:hypothetical protein
MAEADIQVYIFHLPRPGSSMYWYCSAKIVNISNEGYF